MLLVALITVGAFIAAVALWCAYMITVRRHRSAWVRRPKPGICFYLDEENARDIYLQEDKYPDLQRSVQETIRRNIAGLDNANDIVYVDLFNCTLGPSVGLDRALERNHGRKAKRVRTEKLQKLDPFTFVSVMGRFRVTAKSETTTTFSAPYGDPTEVFDDLPRVTVTCDTEQLRRNVPDDPFPARCLGKIKHWDPDTRQLVISPVLAIFQ